jgi:arginase
MTKRIRLFTVPYDSGIRDVRMGAGPGHLLNAGLESHLRAAGHEVSIEPIVVLGDGIRGEIEVTFALIRTLADRVRYASENGWFPVILAGPCYSAVGTIAGLGPRRIGVLWFDSHADFNTPDTTVSGFLDGMALAMVTGRCWTGLVKTVPGFEPIPEDQIVWLGVRDMDPREAALVEESKGRFLSPTQVRSSLDPVLRALARRVDEVYLHVDLDVLDPSEGRANALAAPDGLTTEDMERALQGIGGPLRISAVALTAYDPSFDEDGRVGRAAVGMLDTVLSAVSGL